MSRRRGLLALLVVVIVTGVAAAAWYRRDAFSPKQFVMRGLEERLHSAPSDAATGLVAQIARIDDEGLPKVVELLGSPQQHEALAARDVLRLRLAEWRTLPLPESSHQVSALAEHLAAGMDAFGPTARQTAGDLATTITAWPIDRREVNLARVLSNCELVMTAAEASEGLEPFPVKQASASIGLETKRQPVVGIAEEDVQLAGGGIPSDPVEIAAPLKLGKGGSFGAAEPRTLPPAPSNAHPLQNNREDPRFLPEPRLLPPHDGEPLLPALQSPPEAGVHSPSPLPPAPLDLGELSASLQPLADVEVMRLMQHDEQAVAVAAIEELRSRGFQARHLRLAIRLTSPDPQVRQRLAGELSEVVDIDVRPWIVHLSRDAESAVRKAAAIVMATSDDAKLQARLEEMKGERD